MSNEERTEDHTLSVVWRASSPAYLALIVGGCILLLGILLALWTLSWSIPSGPNSGLAAGLVVMAIVFIWGLAAILAVFGLVLCLLGWGSLRYGWIREPAIISGMGLGVVVSFGLSAFTALGENPTLLSYWNLIPLIAGVVLGWWWSVPIRRHSDEGKDTLEGEMSDKQLGLAGLIVGG
ncbi:MAG: hypothetical protein SV377_01195, partial [Halobacteria archaeon]|nr:hypothetical protein [Halobacteria archaeon]